jgi:hypothetical protein
MLTNVKRLFLYYLLRLHFTCVPSFFVKGLARCACLASFLLNDEVGRAYLIHSSEGTCCRLAPIQALHLQLWLELVGVLANVSQNSLSLFVFNGPLWNVIVGRLVLQPLEDLLVFHRDFEQLLLPVVSVQRLLLAMVDRQRLLRWCLQRIVSWVDVCSLVLQNVCHLLQQNSILPLDFRISFFEHLRFLLLRLQVLELRGTFDVHACLHFS